MDALKKIKFNIVSLVNQALKKRVVKADDLIFPPKPEFGDLSLACFNLAKKYNKTAVEMTEFLVKKIKPDKNISTVNAIGPYLNFTLNKNVLTETIIKEIMNKKNDYGKNRNGKNKKIMVEFAHPNTHKAFHIGHLRNIITGEAISRILENSSYKIIRANYQGDIGLHIAKCLWGINKLKKEYEETERRDLKIKALFLGKAYALGSKNYEEDRTVRKEITTLNKKLYKKDKTITKIYNETRNWSLKYFDIIYKRFATKYNRLYFESEVYNSGREIVLNALKEGIFNVSSGAVIFQGEKYGLHNRVFINSDGNPTYEAKDLGLAKLQFEEFSPEKIIHVVGPEQTEYFKVVFKALELIQPNTKGKEIHLPYGWVRLKEGKMSSRLGNVILGEWLLDEIKNKIIKIVEKNKKSIKKNETAEKITIAAVKYSILKNSLNKDIAFDIDESINLTGNSGPYIQYTYARINSIIKKSNLQFKIQNLKIDFTNLSEKKEHSLIMKLTKYPEIVETAGKSYNPSEIAKYLFELAQEFNDYYHSLPVLKAKLEIKSARLALILTISQVIKNGLNLLGIETVEKM